MSAQYRAGMTGETDLDTLLAELDVTRRPGRFTVVSVPQLDGPLAEPGATEAIVREAEGMTAVVTTEAAERAGVPHDFVAAWLTLDVHSALEAVGLTAAVSAALADRGIPCNVVAGYHHDHLLVPEDRAEEAIACLRALRERPTQRHHAEHGQEHGGHEHGHHHGHEHDQGLTGALRYLRFAPQMWRHSLHDAVLALVAPQPGERIVDVGAGMGAGSMAAARRGAEVVALEPTPFLRRVLEVRRLWPRWRDRITVLDGTAEEMPIDDGTADAVIAVNTMHHWVDPTRGVAEIARVLRPGGRAVLVDEDFDDPTHPDHERFGARHEGGNHGFTMVDGDDIAAGLERHGLAEASADKRELDGRPSIIVTASAPD